MYKEYCKAVIQIIKRKLAKHLTVYTFIELVPNITKQPKDNDNDNEKLHVFYISNEESYYVFYVLRGMPNARMCGRSNLTKRLIHCQSKEIDVNVFHFLSVKINK